jgi:hypothetical protein
MFDAPAAGVTTTAQVAGTLPLIVTVPVVAAQAMFDPPAASKRPTIVSATHGFVARDLAVLMPRPSLKIPFPQFIINYSLFINGIPVYGLFMGIF